MTIDWTINIGAVIGGVVSGFIAVTGTYGAMLRFWHKVDLRIHDAENTLKTHAQALTEHGERASRHEKTMVDVMQDVARIVGQLNPAGWSSERRGSSS
jgi:uncharacterized membrane-anchored protein YhcB (DUF1043 family)